MKCGDCGDMRGAFQPIAHVLPLGTAPAKRVKTPRNSPHPPAPIAWQTNAHAKLVRADRLTPSRTGSTPIRCCRSVCRCRRRRIRARWFGASITPLVLCEKRSVRKRREFSDVSATATHAWLPVSGMDMLGQHTHSTLPTLIIQRVRRFWRSRVLAVSSQSPNRAPRRADDDQGGRIAGHAWPGLEFHAVATAGAAGATKASADGLAAPCVRSTACRPSYCVWREVPT